MVAFIKTVSLFTSNNLFSEQPWNYRFWRLIGKQITNKNIQNCTNESQKLKGGNSGDFPDWNPPTLSHTVWFGVCNENVVTASLILLHLVNSYISQKWAHVPERGYRVFSGEPDTWEEADVYMEICSRGKVNPVKIRSLELTQDTNTDLWPQCIVVNRWNLRFRFRL